MAETVGAGMPGYDAAWRWGSFQFGLTKWHV
jgi:hypothetical protein